MILMTFGMTSVLSMVIRYRLKSFQAEKVELVSPHIATFCSHIAQQTKFSESEICESSRADEQQNACHRARVSSLNLFSNLKLRNLFWYSEWNYPYPFGMGLDEMIDPGVYMCCPTPPIWPDECRAGPVVNTEYVRLVHRECPTAYAYSYDDEAGLHNCPNGISFKVTFCQNI